MRAFDAPQTVVVSSLQLSFRIRKSGTTAIRILGQLLHLFHKLLAHARTGFVILCERGRPSRRLRAEQLWSKVFSHFGEGITANI